MKRWLATGFIVVYLGVLNMGILSHMLGYKTGAHPMMYFIVWDMFCGWTAYDARTHIIGEGESGRYYELAPGPWGEFIPWGHLGRHHYDAVNNHTGRVALNTLKHTTHEPMTRILVIEESWAKKYNIPDPVWALRYDDPKDIQKYYRVRSVIMPDGTYTQNYSPWITYVAQKMLQDNPRLAAQAVKSMPYFMVDQKTPGREMMVPTASVSDFTSYNVSPVGAPNGN